MPTETSNSFTVSVIIPTWNAGPSIKTLLERLWRQSLCPTEIIVIDSSSGDSTVELARENGAKVYTIDQQDYDHGGTRNIASKKASGNILVFMTQDALPNNEYMLQELTKPLITNPKIGCSYGRQIAKSDANILERVSRSYNYPEYSYHKDKKDVPAMGIKAFFCSNVCSAVRKETFDELGRFPQPVIFNEDLFFAAKCVLSGYSVAYVAEAEVLHSHNYSLIQQFKRYFDNGVSMSMNDWVDPYSSVRRAGSGLLKFQINEIIRQQEWKWLPRLVAESFVKLIGYQLGKKHRLLPNGINERFSMHRRIWANLRSKSSNKESMKG